MVDTVYFLSAKSSGIKKRVEEKEKCVFEYLQIVFVEEIKVNVEEVTSHFLLGKEKIAQSKINRFVFPANFLHTITQIVNRT